MVSIAFFAISAAPAPAPAASPDADAVPLSAEAVRAAWRNRLDGRHFAAEMTLKGTISGMPGERRMRVWRDDDAAHERVMIRFETPVDLRKTSLLYIEHEDQPNDYFLFQPRMSRVRRIPEDIASSDLYGIDPEFLGFGLAHTEPTQIEGVQRVELRGRAAYRLDERSLGANPRFVRRRTWIDAETFVALRVEHDDQERTVLTADTVRIENEGGVPTPVAMNFERPHLGDRFTLEVEKIDFGSPIPEQYFSAFSLVRGSHK
jgi:hypothetical protein